MCSHQYACHPILFEGQKLTIEQQLKGYHSMRELYEIQPTMDKLKRLIGEWTHTRPNFSKQKRGKKMYMK